MIITEQSFSSLLEKVKKLKVEAGVDLSTSEDLSVAVMNLISLEEHFFFTGVKTNDDSYFESGAEIRELRKELLGRLMADHEGETWCVSKHLLSATMRLIEVGYKLQSENKKTEAGEMFKRAYKIYSIFWLLKLKLVDVKQKPATPAGSRLEQIIGELANCCDE
ncbi:MAG: hypothetical protein AAB821_03475 [Patescibacteria group bacterium]